MDQNIDSTKMSIQSLEGAVVHTKGRVDVLERRIEELASQPRWPKASGPTSTTSTSSTSSPVPAGRASDGSAAGRFEDGAWRPRTLFIHGWSPYGSPAATKISRPEVQHLDTRLQEPLGELHSELKILAHYACNH